MTRKNSIRDSANHGGGSPRNARLIRPGDPEYRRALHKALDLPNSPADSLAPEAASLLSRADRGEVSIDLLFASFGQGALLSAAVAVESPGAAALVSFPTNAPDAAREEATVAVLEAVCEAAWATPLVLLEALVPEGAVAATRSLQEAGFRRLTRLVYLTRVVDSPAVPFRPPSGLRWVAYSEASKPLFCTVLEQSYVQSLDCPELTGIRSTEDVLAGHQATGTFDPSNWWVAMVNDEPAGILCLNRVTGQTATEIVYVGVASTFRGRGIGNALLARAVSESHRVSAKLVTLAVDERNVPARELYDRWRFKAALLRDAWIVSRNHPVP